MLRKTSLLHVVFFCIIIINNDNNKNSPALDSINIMLRAFHIFFSFLLCYSSSEIFVAAFVCFIKRFYIVCSSFSILFAIFLQLPIANLYLCVMLFHLFCSEQRPIRKQRHAYECECVCLCAQHDFLQRDIL